MYNAVNYYKFMLCKNIFYNILFEFIFYCRFYGSSLFNKTSPGGSQEHERKKSLFRLITESTIIFAMVGVYFYIVKKIVLTNLKGYIIKILKD
jgi:hypothetical protein